jgi:hypothetical protein
MDLRCKKEIRVSLSFKLLLLSGTYSKYGTDLAL